MREDEQVPCRSCYAGPNDWEGIFAGRPAPSVHFLEGSNGREGKVSIECARIRAASCCRPDRSGLAWCMLCCVLLLVPSDSDSTDHLYLSIFNFFRCSLHFVLGTFGIAWYYCLRVCYVGSLGRAHMKVSTMYMCSICLLVAYLKCCVLLERWSLPQCCSSWRPLARALRTYAPVAYLCPDRGTEIPSFLNIRTDHLGVTHPRDD